MRSLAPRLFAASMAALTLTTGAAVSARAATAGTNPGCGWHTLTLLNGWKSEQSTWHSGNPAYCITGDGIVHLAGSLAQAHIGRTEFAVLPKSARPASTLYFTTYTNAGAVGAVRVSTNGQLHATGGDAPKFTSLAGLSFPTAATVKTGHRIAPLINSWHSGQATFGTGNPSYVIRQGIVHLAGSVLYGKTTPPASGSSQWIFAPLPKAAKPTDCFGEDVYTYGGGTSPVVIDPANGHIYAADPYFTSLAGISYPAAPVTWHKLPLLSGGTPLPGCKAPSFHLSHGVVYFTGGMQLSGDGTCAVLPPAVRPTHSLYFDVEGDGSADGQYTIVSIKPDGTMYAWGPSSNNYFLSVDGLSYPLGS